MLVVNIEDIKLDNSAVALGKFQGLHLGHMLLLDRTKEIADLNGLNSIVCSVDVPYNKALYCQEERIQIIENKGIDYVVSCAFTREFASLTPERFVKDVLVERLGARYVIVGADFCFGCNRQGNVDTMREIGKIYSINVVVLDKLTADGEIISTSLIKDIILSGEVHRVKDFLGRYYSVTGRILHGRSLGRTIGFPTINIIPKEEKLLPPIGVYESRIIYNNKTYKGVTNIGNNPTVTDDKRILIETNIIDFNEDLYDNEVTVEFVKFIRPQIKFNSIDELKEQISIDKMSVMHQ